MSFEPTKPPSGRINICCGRSVIEGWWNVDIHPWPGVNETVNLDKDWPWEDDCVDEIFAKDAVEHLRDPIHVMNEAWRVLKPGGIFTIIVPSTDGRGAFQDPTHVSFWNENSFLYYDVEQEEYWAQYPRIKARFSIERRTTERSPQGVVYVLARCIKVVPDAAE